MMRASLTFIRRGCAETTAELVVVREGVQVVAALTDADLTRLARQALTVLPDPASAFGPDAAFGLASLGLGVVEGVGHDRDGAALVDVGAVSDRQPSAHNGRGEVDASFGATNSNGPLMAVDVRHDAPDETNGPEQIVDDGTGARAPGPDVHLGGVDAVEADAHAIVHQQRVAIERDGAALEGVPFGDISGQPGASAAGQGQGGNGRRDQKAHGDESARAARVAQGGAA